MTPQVLLLLLFHPGGWECFKWDRELHQDHARVEMRQRPSEEVGSFSLTIHANLQKEASNRSVVEEILAQLEGHSGCHIGAYEF